MEQNNNFLRARARLDRPPPIDFATDALFLDLDGTLLDIALRPDLVRADELLRGLLRELEVRLDGALAIVSGRSISDIDAVLGATSRHVSGLHGQEHRFSDKTMRPRRSRQVEAAAATIKHLRLHDLLKVAIENKGAAIVVHYRQAPEHEQLVRRAADEIASRTGLKALHGGMVVEFLPSDASKGEAICLFMKTPPFAGRRPIAVGDDGADESAFGEARRLGGSGILVGEMRATAATHGLQTVSAVRSWLLSSLGRTLA